MKIRQLTIIESGRGEFYVLFHIIIPHFILIVRESKSYELRHDEFECHYRIFDCYVQVVAFKNVTFYYKFTHIESGMGAGALGQLG